MELSYSRGSDTVPLVEQTIGNMFDIIVSKYPDNDAVISVHQNVRLTYRDLQQEVDAFCKGLIALGIWKGDHIGIWATNCKEWVIAQFATAKIGVILVNLNPAYKTSELKYALQQSEAVAIITMEKFKTSNYIEMLSDIIFDLPKLRQVITLSGRLPGLVNTPLLSQHLWTEVIDAGSRISDHELRFHAEGLDCYEPINIQYTSGTTGFPKGVVLTHYNILNNAIQMAENMRMTDKDRLCIPVPFYHCFGMVVSNLVCMVKGATMVLPAEHFDPKKVLVAIEKEHCTVLHGVPTMFIAELEVLDHTWYDLSTLRTGIMAGAPCPIEVMKKVNTLMHMSEVTIGYGLTEVSPLITMTLPDDPLEKRVSTVGRAMQHAEVAIMRDGKIVPRGEIGEVCTRGYMVMAGYYANPEATSKTFDPNGWLLSGDLGTMDSEGYVKITGRSKDMCIRKGENLYPREIEEFLFTHPSIEDVQVFGVPDLISGEELVAWIKLKPGYESMTAEDVKVFCQGKIAHFKIPKYIKFVTEFPMTVTGKPQKYKMREVAIKDYALEEAAKVKTA